MVLFSIIGASLVYTCFVTSQPQHVDTGFLNPNELKGTLDWLHKFSLHHDGKKEEYKELGETIMKYIGLSYRFDYGEILDRFITDVHELRTALVKGDAEDIIISEVATVNMRSLQSSIFIVRDCFDDLKSNITEWEKEAKGVSSDIKTTGPKQLLWFKEQGFNETILNTITIEELKERIDGIYGHNKPMYRLLELFSTAFFHEIPHDSSSLYARVDTIAGSLEAISLIDNYLKSDHDRVPRTIATQIVDSLRELGKEGTPLRKYNETYQDASIYSYYMKVMSTSVFTESSVSRYLAIISELCTTIASEKSAVKELLRFPQGYKATCMYKHCGNLSFSARSETELIDKVCLLYGNQPMTSLCNAMMKYRFLLANKGNADATTNKVRMRKRNVAILHSI